MIFKYAKLDIDKEILTGVNLLYKVLKDRLIETFECIYERVTFSGNCLLQFGNHSRK